MYIKYCIIINILLGYEYRKQGSLKAINHSSKREGMQTIYIE